MQRKWRRDWERGKAAYPKHGLLKPLQKLAKSLLPPVAAAGILLGGLSDASAGTVLPTGGEITGGAGTISQSGSTLTVQQLTDKMVANWQSFSIGPDGKVVFNQPGVNSVALNRVLGNDPSHIYGQLLANGKVFLINANGVLFAPGAQVNVGGLVASSLNMSDADFLAGKYQLTGDMGSGSVINQGTLTAADGSYIALLGPEVVNEGLIVAQKGTVALGAGQAMTLDLQGDKLLSLAVDQAALDAGAANHNLIQADGGQVIITARAANALARTVVNNSGLIQARSVDKQNGEIILDGGLQGATVNSGTLDASGAKAGENGGTVKVLGDQVTLTGTARVDVSGAAGGGTALIGGNYQGRGTEQNATHTTVDQGAEIKADATVAGDGGQVVVWANDTTNFAGRISARGGAAGGDGGSAEVSGKQTLLYKGYTDLRAPRGLTGTLLLDPGEYTISNAATDGNIYNVTELGNQLNAANITLQTDGSGSGDITVAADLNNWTSDHTLTLKAHNDIKVNALVQSTGGGDVVLRADSDADSSGTVSFGNNGKVKTDGDVSIYYNPGGTATATVNGAEVTVKDYNNPTNYASYVQNTAGGAGDVTAYMLVNNVTELQAVNNNLYGVYALGRDIDASATRNWNDGAGFVPIGIHEIAVYDPVKSEYNITYSLGSFEGIFDGDGHAIRELYIHDYDDSYITGVGPIGLFVRMSRSGMIENLGLKNVNITSDVDSASIGGLVGSFESGNIINCYITGTITGSNADKVGGLVGYMGGGQIINSSSAALVQGTGLYGIIVGGLVGYKDGGSIDSCSTSGSVTGLITLFPDKNIYIGGMVGYNNGSITNSYNTAAVTGLSYVGGLVGWNETGGNIKNCYNAGAVSSSGTSGGIAGQNCGKITGSYNTGSVTGSWMTGGLAGIVDYGALIADSYSTGTVIGDGINGGLVGMLSDGGSISRCYSAGAVTGGYMTGGFVGYAANTDGITGSYWDMDSSGQQFGHWDGGSIAGLTGLSVSNGDPYSQSSYGNFDFDHTWYMVDGYTRPFLQWEYSTTITNAHQLQLMAKDLSAAYTLAGNIDMKNFNMARGGFMPVGNADTPFTGSLNGNGYTVNRLTINTTAYRETGLFGYLRNASVSNVGLYDAHISGGISNVYVGSLAGCNEGGSIANVYSTGSVSGQGAVGGLVGYNNGTITAAYSTSQVNVGDGGEAGGLVGENDGRISGSYSTGPVSGGAGATVGGFVGTNGSSGRVEDSCWDKETSGQTEGMGSDTGSGTGITGLTIAQMRDKAYLAGLGFDFAKTWFMLDGSTRPFLRTENVAAISNAHQLQLMGANLSGDYTLDSSFDLSELGSAAGMWNPTSGFVSIGGSDTPFTGILSGGGHTVSGLIVNKSAAAAIGLFGALEGAVISGVGLRDVQITGGAANLYVGGLAGSNNGGYIFNTYVTGTVSGTTNVGGLTGRNNGLVMFSYNAGTVSGTGNVGGIAGLNAGSLAECYNRGTVETAAGAGDGSRVGGVAGLNTGNIAGSYNAAGTVKANNAGDMAGGLAGENDGTMSGSYNAGIVTANAADSAVGGATGKNSGSISGSYNAGEVKANTSGGTAGGVAGINTGDITGSYNNAAGTVTGNAAGTVVGGVAGENDGSINGSYNKGTVSTYYENSIIGGLTGVNKKTITGSYNSSALSNNVAGNILGGLAGENYGTISGNSYNAGAVTATGANCVTGGVAGKNYGGITKTYNTGNLISYAAGNVLGGLAGENGPAGSISQSYNTGAVTTNTAAADNSIGGVVGRNYGLISSVYNQAKITAGGTGNRVGGLAGWNAAGGRIVNCWNSTARLTANGDKSIAGGLAGQNDGDIAYSFAVTPLTVSGADSTAGALVGVNNGTISNGYWNTDIAGLSKGVGSGAAGGVQGKTVAEMMQPGTYAGWDLPDIWNVVAGSSFPYLTWQFDGAPAFISGRAQGGGSGKNIVIHLYDTDQWFHGAKAKTGELQLNTLAADGFYYMVVPSALTVPDNALLLYYVTGDDNYKANALYRYGSNGVLHGDLQKNTLIVNGGDFPVGYIPSSVPVADSLFAYPYKPGRYGQYLEVTGDFQAYNFLCTPLHFDWGLITETPRGISGLTAAGSVIIINPAGDYGFAATMDLSTQWSGTFGYTKLTDIEEIRTPIIAGGDITYITGRNLLISTGGQFTAGGNITLVTDSGFLNNAGTDVFNLTGGGRWLVYAPDRLLYQSSRLFYLQPKYAEIYKNHTGSWAEYFQNYLSGTELVCDGQGGLNGYFTQWGTTYGGAVPADGNGFVYTVTHPALRLLTPVQEHRKAALVTAQNHQAYGRETAMPEISDPALPFLTVVGTGVALEGAGSGQVTVEPPTGPVASPPDSGMNATVTEK